MPSCCEKRCALKGAKVGLRDKGEPCLMMGTLCPSGVESGSDSSNICSHQILISKVYRPKPHTAGNVAAVNVQQAKPRKSEPRRKPPCRLGLARKSVNLLKDAQSAPPEAENGNPSAGQQGHGSQKSWAVRLSGPPRAPSESNWGRRKPASPKTWAPQNSPCVSHKGASFPSCHSSPAER